MVQISGTNNSYIDEIIGFSVIILMFVILRPIFFVNTDLWVLGVIIVIGMVLGGVFSAIAANLLKLEVFSEEYAEDITSIDLSARSIISIDLSELPSLTKLKHLNLEDNKIDKIDFAPFRKHPSLEDLDVSNNNLEVVDLTVLKTCKKLQRLDLRRNQIENIEVADLLNLSGFKTLEIDNTTNLTVDGVELTIEQFHQMLESNIKDVDQFLAQQ